MNDPARIFLIDDDEISNFINETILKSFFKESEIISFSNPEKALEFIFDDYSKNPLFSVLFVDINMPEMSGWDFLDKLLLGSKSLMDYLRIIMVSSSIDALDKEKAQRNPFVNGFVSKPLSLEQIRKLFRKE
jgi:CheY-like chemotaxis protein